MTNYPGDAAISDRFFSELAAVRQLLETIGSNLEMPLGNLVQAQIETARPELRAAVVLATAVGESELTLAQASMLHEQRINLAAALEMLYVALSVHKLLLRDEIQPTDKSLLGGAILAGDYCFSQSANLAVKTNHPQVVEIFAQALKETSESNLRHVFDDSDTVSSENQTLCRSGAQAGSILAAHAAGMSAGESDVDLLTTVAAVVAYAETSPPESRPEIGGLSRLPHRQRMRFASLLNWLSTVSSTDSDHSHSV